MVNLLTPELTPPNPPAMVFSVNAQLHSITYDHIRERIRDPVRSPLVKLARARSVVRSVTTSESLVLYVFDPF
jgi:hypothetical protein